MSGQVELIYPTLSSGDEWDGESSLALVLQGNTVGGGATRLHLNSPHHHHGYGADPAASDCMT